MEIQATKTKYDIGDVVFYMLNNSVKQGVVLKVTYKKESSILFLDDEDRCLLSSVETKKAYQKPDETVAYVVAMCVEIGGDMIYHRHFPTELSESQMFKTKEDLLKTL